MLMNISIMLLWWFLSFSFLLVGHLKVFLALLYVHMFSRVDAQPPLDLNPTVENDITLVLYTFNIS